MLSSGTRLSVRSRGLGPATLGPTDRLVLFARFLIEFLSALLGMAFFLAAHFGPSPSSGPITLLSSLTMVSAPMAAKDFNLTRPDF